MLKRSITYTNFNDEEITGIFYFNLSKPELIEMEVEIDGGMAHMLQKIIDANSGKDIIKQFKNIILMSYGVRSDDGNRFIKNDQLREEFSQTAAYHVLFMELSTNAEAAATFIKGIIPKDLADSVDTPDKTVTHDGRTTTAV